MSLSVLVIDDQPLEGEMISLILAQNCPDVSYAGQALNAAVGIGMTAQHQPDLIFLDIKLPGMDGLQAISHLKQACPHTQIVMLTAFDDFEYLRAALRAGARDYLLKPVRPTDILSALETLRCEAPPRQAPAVQTVSSHTELLTEAIHAGDSRRAGQAAQEYLDHLALLDQSSTIHICVRCMELAAELSHASGDGPFSNGLSFLYQEFVHQVSAVKELEPLRSCFTDFAEKAADVYGHTAGDISYRQVAEAKQYISEHFHEPLQLSEVARKLYLSAAYFSRLFKDKTGMTFSDYLASCRIEKAKQLLATTDLSIAEVAAAIGYQEANSFSRVFKVRAGQSPSHYRTAQHRL